MTAHIPTLSLSDVETPPFVSAIGEAYEHYGFVIIENHGSIFLFRPRTGYAADWLRENVASEGWQWFGGALAVEPRYAGQLVCGIEDAGFSVR